MTVVLLASILSTAAVPGLRWLIDDVRRTADINALVGAIQLARSESAKRGAEVRLCPSADGSTCLADGGRFGFGWIVRVERAADAAHPAAAADDAAAEILFGYTPRIQGTIRANRNAFVFRPHFRRGTNGTFTFCDPRGADSARAVIVSYTGRPRVADSGPGGRRLECPGASDG